MTWRAASVVVWSVVALSLLGTQVAAIASRGRLPTIDAVLRTIVGSRPGRAAILLGWMWLGWHAFAR